MYVGKSLADGQVAASKSTLYTVPTGKRVIVKTFNVFNTNSTAETVKVYVKRSGSSSRQFAQAVLGQNERAKFISDAESLVLSENDQLEGETTTASFVDYVITGAEE